jgi:hypothetical protein
VVLGVRYAKAVFSSIPGCEIYDGNEDIREVEVRDVENRMGAAVLPRAMDLWPQGNQSCNVTNFVDFDFMLFVSIPEACWWAISVIIVD